MRVCGFVCVLCAGEGLVLVYMCVCVCVEDLLFVSFSL